MKLPESSVVKYIIKLKFEVEGLVEKADLIGAIFGQTEGLFGPELNLNELQKTGKVGRIDIILNPKDGKTYGEVLIPTSLDINTSALIAAAVEHVEKVGPYSAKFSLHTIEDIRSTKRKLIVERAKEIVKQWATKVTSESEDYIRELMESTKRARVVNYGKEGLPAGPGIFDSEELYVVEGRADVINLLRAGIDNVIALDGVNIPESIIKLSNEKKLIAFLDGDRAGDLILKELTKVAKIHKVYRAPPGKEVEELTPLEILEILKGPPVETGLTKELEEKVKELYPNLNGTLEAELLDEQMKSIARVPVSELINKINEVGNVSYIIFDGIITQRLVDSCLKAKVKALVGHRIGELSNRPKDIILTTFKDLKIDSS